MDNRSDLKKIKKELNDHLCQTLARFLIEKNINRKENIIIEEKKDNFYIGHTSNYIF